MRNRLVIIGSPFRPLILGVLVLLLACSVQGQPGRTSVKLSSNYNASAVHSMAAVGLPLQVPLSLPKHSDPNPVAVAPINQKHAIGLNRPSAASLDLAGLQERMVHVDYQMIYEQNPPNSVFQQRISEEYHLLESRQFFINVANPSEVFSICINEIFSDCQSIKKAMKKPLPLCINPFTKYPIYFNLYVTHFRNRELIKSAIFFNVTLKYQNQAVFNRVWMRQVKFNLLHNHLKLLPFQIRNCQHENSVVAIKNPEKIDLSFLLIHKFRKYHMNGQPLDDKFTIASQKTFRFMIQAKDSTITIYSKPQDNSSEKAYPVLYVPVFCFDRVTIENIPIGILTANHLSLTYPLLLTSNTNSPVTVEEISLTSTSNTVQLIRLPTSKSQLQSIQRYVQVASIIVRSALKPSFKNSITVKVKYSLSTSTGGNSTLQAKKTFTYSQLYGAITVGENRFYQISRLPQGEYNDVDKILHFNYSVINKMAIPIRMERILFNSQKFKMHWFRYSGLYIFPQRVKQEILLEYVGPRQIPISPVKYAAAIEFSGGISVPFQVMIYDRTLACLHQGKQTRCSALKYINFGYQKSQQRIQQQTVVIRNFNPHPVSISVNILPNLTKTHGLQLSFSFSQPIPPYKNYMRQTEGRTIISLHSGHLMNLTVEMRIVSVPLSGETFLNISTQYEQFSPKIKFNFQEGRLLFSPSNYHITHFDRPHRGVLHLVSTFQDPYTIRQVISDTTSLQFIFNDTQQFQANQRVSIPFEYNPHRDESNLTGECCSEQFLKNHYMHALIYYQESNARSHEVTLITNGDYQQHLQVKVDIQKAALLPMAGGSRKVSISALSIANSAKFCLQVANPYSATLKYGVFFIPDAVVYKPKDYHDYFKHARRERIEAYLCLPTNKKATQAAAALKTMLRLQQNPSKVQINVDAMGNVGFDSLQRDNLSSNEYVSAMVERGEQNCYKMQTLLYFKLLVESQVVNVILESHSLEVLIKFVEKEWQHLQNSTVAYLDDPFYRELRIKLQDYCNTAFFPIFRFCHHYPITPTYPPGHSQKIKAPQARLLQANTSEQLCFLVDNTQSSKKETSFQLVVANNYSKYDDYKVELSFIEPKVSVGNIAFQKDHRINHEIFIKHYFSALAKAQSSQLLSQGIDNRHRVIPLYLTSQDYQQEFGLFRGERFFQIQNHSPKDIQFTHFGFEDKENMSEWAGLRIEAVGNGGNQANGGNFQGLQAREKTVFRLSFLLDQPFEFNLSNPYFHRKISLYLYNHQEYYLSLTLLLRVADNVVQKIKIASQPTSTQGSRLIYFLLNFLSVGYICMVLVSFQKEEAEKKLRMEVALQKQKKIIPQQRKQRREQSSIGFVQDKLKQKTHILLPQSIGSKLKPQDQPRHVPVCLITQQQLAFFKSLKMQKDKSFIISESSEDHLLRASNQQAEKTEEKSLTTQKDYHEQHQSRQISEPNQVVDQPPSELQSEESVQSLSESILPDGISVCNQQLDTLDEFDDFQFGFESKRKKEEKVKKEEEVGYYDVFSNHNPLKKEKVEAKENPFPWMNQLEKKKSHRPKRQKEETL